MGQYFQFMNIEKKESLDSYAFEYGGKKYEVSNIKNRVPQTCLSLLSDKWTNDRVVLVGDYASKDGVGQVSLLLEEIDYELNLEGTPLYEIVYEEDDYDSEVERQIYFNEINYDVFRFLDYNAIQINTRIRYVYNISKSEFIDLFKQPASFYIHENKLCYSKINSFAMLVICDTSKYIIDQEYKYGYWAGDRFESSEEKLEKYKNYVELEYAFDFESDSELFSEIDYKISLIKTLSQVKDIKEIDLNYDKTFMCKKEIELYDWIIKHFLYNLENEGPDEISIYLDKREKKYKSKYHYLTKDICLYNGKNYSLETNLIVIFNFEKGDNDDFKVMSGDEEIHYLIFNSIVYENETSLIFLENYLNDALNYARKNNLLKIGIPNIANRYNKFEVVDMIRVYLNTFKEWCNANLDYSVEIIIFYEDSKMLDEFKTIYQKYYKIY